MTRKYLRTQRGGLGAGTTATGADIGEADILYHLERSRYEIVLMGHHLCDTPHITATATDLLILFEVMLHSDMG